MNLKFSTKLYVVFSAIILFAVASFSLFIRVHIFKRMEEDTVYNNLQLCIKVSENVDTYIEKLDDIAKKLISDPRLLKIMREVRNNPEMESDYGELKREREISTVVSNAITLTSFPHVNVYLYSKDGSYAYVYNQDRSNFKEALAIGDNYGKLEKKRLVIYADNGKDLPDGGDMPDEKDCSISFIRAIFDVSANQYGYIEVQSDYKKLDEICNINHIGSVILMNERGDIVYPFYPVSEEVKEELELGKNGKRPGEERGFFTAGKQMYFYAVSDNSGITTYIRYPEDTVRSQMKLLQHTTVIFFICVTAAAILMFVIFSGMLVKPLKELRNSVLEITYENMGISFHNSYHNEIVELKDAFQKILDDLKRSALREIESNKAEAQARLAALQAQISPHFIHNVLYSISIAAKEGRPSDVQAMCKQLSDMLRYTVNSNAHMVELKEEIKCIANYLALQKQYYEDFLQYDIGMEETAGSIKVPRLSVLPFVENAIGHTFEGKKPPYRIEVWAKGTEEGWTIEIRDNGKGFSKDKIKEIEERLAEDDLALDMEARGEEEPGMGGMGILNTVLRLRIFFQGRFDFEIRENASGEGSTVCLRREE